MTFRRARRLSLLAAVIAAVTAVGALQFTSVFAHEAAEEPHKDLFPERWYHSPGTTPWLELSTSALRADCDGSAAACGAKWNSPVTGGIFDWNLSNTTVVIDPKADKSTLYDMNIQVLDSLCDIDPSVTPPDNDCDALGVQAPFDSNYDYCNAACSMFYSWVFINDDQHAGDFAVESQRQGTTAHELGHALGLTHESSGLDCGQGPGGTTVPRSIMAYDCIDPVTYDNGKDEGYVHDWDVCGVNHAYYDPAIGYAGCAPTCGGTNPGFEAGNLNGWTQGAVTESIVVVGNDVINGGAIATPLEGNSMARLGMKQASGSFGQQPQGPNELSQTWTVENPLFRCAYNFWTYDYFGFDEVTVEVSRVDTGAVIYSTRTGAFGPSGNTELKTTGWRIVNVDLRAHLGKQVKVTFNSQGTKDDHYSSWAYLDSAEMQVPVGVVDTPATTVDGEPPTIDPTTGQIVIPQSPGDDTLQISTPISCPNGGAPTAVTATLSKAPESPHDAPTIQISLVKGGGNIWTGTFDLPSDQPDATIWDLNYFVVCPDVGTITVPVGKVILIDPSGFVTDSVTHLPIESATVRLQRFESGEWSDVNPFALVDDQPTIAPQINPLQTNSQGHYAWDVAAGKYRVIVSAPGYITQTSREVDIPPPVLDLDLELVPVGGATPTPTVAPSPTVTPQQRKWGDVDCNGGVNPVDSLKILRVDAGMNVVQPTGCPNLKTNVVVNGTPRVWGDVDCNGSANPVDSLKLLRFDAAQLVQQPSGCPGLGTNVNLGSAGTGTPTSAPTAAPTATPTATPAVTATPTTAVTATQSPTPTPTAMPTPTPTATQSPQPTQAPTTDCANLDPPLAIPDDDETGVNLVATVDPPGLGVIADLNLCLNIEHEWVGDLVITVTHEDTGTSILLMEHSNLGEKDCSGDDLFVYFDDEADESADQDCSNGTPALMGAYRPYEALAAFDGEEFDGTWTINIADTIFKFEGHALGGVFFIANP